MQLSKQPTMILTCQHDSHYFEERTIVFNDVIKVGRAVARTKASFNNAIFDCKVLSRNHAIIWFKSDEFWLRDTNSSNGTFVNNTRITKRDENESCDRQIFSGDVIRFGVDVVENDTTHGCIIASVTLFLPNGCEAKPKLGQVCPETVSAGHIPVNAEQIFQLSCFLNDSIFREQALENKLESLRQALQDAELASEIGWKAMLNEERLLEKLNLYEEQARIYTQQLSEDAVQSNLNELMQEKASQESKMKAELSAILIEKCGAFQKVRELERSLLTLKEECDYLRENYSSSQTAYGTLCTEFKSTISDANQRLADSNVDKNNFEEEIAKKIEENNILQQKVDQLFKELTQNQKNIPNGRSSVGQSERENEATSTSDDNETELNTHSNLDRVTDGEVNISAVSDPIDASHICGDDLSVRNHSESSKHLSDSITEFQLSIKSLHLLEEKMKNSDVFPVSKDEDESRLLKSPVTIVQDILRHQDSAISNLRAYLQQINQISAIELLQTLHEKIIVNVEMNERPTDDKRSLSPDSVTQITDSHNYLNSFSENLLESVKFAELSDVKRVSIEFSKLDVSDDIPNSGPWSLQSPTINQSSADRLKTFSVIPDNKEPELPNEKVLLEMHSKLNFFEDQLRKTQDTHQLLLEDTRHRQAEMQSLRIERDNLEAMLVASQLQVELLRVHSGAEKTIPSGQLSSENGEDITTSSIDANDSSVLVDNHQESETFELMPQRLVTAYNLVVLPFILIVFSVMFVIFSKFIS